MNPHILQPDDVTVVGRITKPHGYKGSVKIQIEHAGAENRITEWVMLMIDQKPVPFFIESVQGSTDSLIVKLEDIETEVQALTLKGVEVALPSGDLPEKIISGVEALIGYAVQDERHAVLGRIKETMDHGYQQLILVEESNGHTFMVPFVEPIIIEVSQADQTITVSLPEGLRDIN